MRWTRFLRRSRFEQDLSDEVTHYLAMAADEYVRAGMSRQEAMRRARVEFGGVESAKEEVRSAGWNGLLDSVARDLHYAVRSLRASPGYAALVVGTLSVGLALTTAVLTAANTVLREPWAVADASHVYQMLSRRGGPAISPAGARFLASRAASIGNVVATRCVGSVNDECSLDLNGTRANVDLVSGNYFAALGIPLQLGRGFLGDEDLIEDPRTVVVLSDDVWRARFGADTGIIGRRVRIDDVLFTVVGVAAPGFVGTETEPRQAWVPLASLLALRPNRQSARDQLIAPAPDATEARVAIRLSAGVSRQRAESELGAIVRVYRETNALSDRGLRLVPTTLFPNPSKQNVALAVFGLMFTAVLLVLMLACANSGNLLLARATSRGREIAIRLALGASRGRVIRQLLIESALLAVASGVIGVAIAYRLPAAIMAGTLGELSWHFVPDSLIIGSALALTIFTCIAFGLAPALHATRTDVATAFKGDANGTGGGRRSRLRGFLLAVQVCVSVVLVLNAGLLIRAVQFGRDREIGFRPSGVATIAVTLPASYDSGRVASFARQLMRDRSSFGASQVAFMRDAPLGSGRRDRVRLPGEKESSVHLPWIAEMTPGTLELLGMSIVAGRDLTDSDADAVLVNESLAHILWPGEQALGKTVFDGSERRVVGIVKDASMYRIDRTEGVLFRPLRFAGVPLILVRGASPASVKAVATMALRLDAHATIQSDSLVANRDRQLGSSRIASELASTLGILSLLLASVGVFGVFSFVVQQRTREIGIRTALGASRRHVLGAVVRENAVASALGLVIGLLVALGIGKILESQFSALNGASAWDPLVIGGTMLLLVAAGGIATWIPARRAARIDPMVALRHE